MLGLHAAFLLGVRLEQVLVTFVLGAEVLEQANAELSDVVCRHQQELDSLRARLAELLRRLDAAQTPATFSPQDEAPPHY